jgi:hypothetical protein
MLRRLGLIGLAPSLGGALLLLVSPASATTPTDPSITLDYVCDVAGSPAQEAVTVSLTMSKAPPQVASGESLELDGEMLITYSPTVAAESRLGLSTSASIGPTVFQALAVSGKTKQSIPLSFQSPQRAPVGRPFTLSAPFRLGPVVLDDQMTETELTLTPPSSNSLANSVRPSPAKVAFTTTITQNSLLMPARKVACWVPSGKTLPQIAQFRLAGTHQGSQPAPGSDSHSTSAPVPLADPTSSTGGTPPQISLPASSSVAEPSLTTPVGGAPTTQVSAPIPPATTRSGTFIPAWTLIVMGAAPALACIAIALRQHQLVQAARKASTSTHQAPNGIG